MKEFTIIIPATETRTYTFPPKKNAGSRLVRIAAALATMASAVLILGFLSGCNKQPTEETTTKPIETKSPTVTATPTTTPTPISEPSPRYALTDAERWEIASVVTAEATGEPYLGKIAVAQCILQTCEDEGLRPSAVLKQWKYSPRRPEPSAESMKAVAEVFDDGIMATSEPIKYFYAHNRTVSAWHESQAYVCTINNHKFFKEAK